MKYLTFLFLIIIFTFVAANAQQPRKIKRPVKNPPQFPNIIDLEDKTERPEQEKASEEQPLQSDALVRAVEALTGEMKTLVQEVRSLNIRQQAQLDMLRMSRIDLRIDYYARELLPVRQRITALQAEEQNLYLLMTQESLVAQTANIPTLNRDKTIEQFKLNHQTRLNLVKSEIERMKIVEDELAATLEVFQKLSAEAEKRIQAAEQHLKQIETDKISTEKDKSERKPDDVP